MYWHTNLNNSGVQHWFKHKITTLHKSLFAGNTRYSISLLLFECTVIFAQQIYLLLQYLISEINFSYLLKNSVPGSNLMGFYPFIAGSVFRFLFLLNVNSRRIQEGKICGGKQEKCKENGRKL